MTLIKKLSVPEEKKPRNRYRTGRSRNSVELAVSENIKGKWGTELGEVENLTDSSRSYPRPWWCAGSSTTPRPCLLGCPLSSYQKITVGLIPSNQTLTDQQAQSNQPFFRDLSVPEKKIIWTVWKLNRELTVLTCLPNTDRDGVQRAVRLRCPMGCPRFILTTNNSRNNTFKPNLIRPKIGLFYSNFFGKLTVSEKGKMIRSGSLNRELTLWVSGCREQYDSAAQSAGMPPLERDADTKSTALRPHHAGNLCIYIHIRRFFWIYVLHF